MNRLARQIVSLSVKRGRPRRPNGHIGVDKNPPVRVSVSFTEEQNKELEIMAAELKITRHALIGALAQHSMNQLKDEFIQKGALPHGIRMDQ